MLYLNAPGLAVGSEAAPINTFDIDLRAASSQMITKYGYGLILFIDDPENPKVIEYFRQFARKYTNLITYNTYALVVSRRGDDLLEKLRAKTQTIQPYIFDEYQELAKKYKTTRPLSNHFSNTTVIINKEHKIVYYQRGLVPVDRLVSLLRELNEPTRSKQQ